MSRYKLPRLLLLAILATTLLLFPLLLSRESSGQGVYSPTQCGPNGCPPSSGGGSGYVQTYPYYGSSQPAFPPQSQSATPSESDVIVRSTSRGLSYTDVGSGTVIANDEGGSLILTNFHVVRRGDSGTSIHNQFSVIQPAKQCSYDQCTYVDSDPKNDLAIIRVPATLRPVKIIYNPNTQDTFASVGFRNNRFYRIPQRVIGRASFGDGDPGALFTLSNGIHSGQSGGAVYDSQGNLVAVNWGSRGVDSSAVWGGPIRRLVQRCCRVPGVQVQTVPPSINPPSPSPDDNVHSPTPPIPPSDPPCNCDPDKITAIEKELASLSIQVSSLATSDTSSFVTKTELESKINSLKEELNGSIATIKTDVNSISQAVAEINVAVSTLCQQPTPADPPSPTDPPPIQDDPLPDSESRILYFTSTKGCPACSPVDGKIKSLKSKGYPITVIDLDPTQTTVQGVPRLFIPDKEKTVQGIANIETYLALLTPQ